MDATARIVLIVVLLVVAIGLLPTWPYSTGWGWGYYPSGLLGLVLLVLLVMALMGRKPLV
jgi:hypothetical protein